MNHEQIFSNSNVLFKSLQRVCTLKHQQLLLPILLRRGHSLIQSVNIDKWHRSFTLLGFLVIVLIRILGFTDAIARVVVLTHNFNLGLDRSRIIFLLPH